MDSTAQGCGKLILAGEHAVVHGIPAIAVGIDRGARARVRAANANRLRIAPWNVDVTEHASPRWAYALHAALALAFAGTFFVEHLVSVQLAYALRAAISLAVTASPRAARSILSSPSLASSVRWPTSVTLMT